MADFPIGGGTKSFSSGVGTTTKGIAVLSSSSANTLGSIVELIASTPYASSNIDVIIAELTFASAAPEDFLLNIYTGATGFEELLVEGIHFSSDNSVTNYTHQSFRYPIEIPAGTRISADIQSSGAAINGAFVFCNFLVGNFQTVKGFSAIESFGPDTSNSASTIIVDPGSTINTKGAWTEIVSIANNVSGFNGCGLSIGANGNGGLDNANWMFDIGVGNVGFEDVYISNIYCISTSSELNWQDDNWQNIKLPRAQRIAIRSASDENQSADRLRSVIFHGAR